MSEKPSAHPELHKDFSSSKLNWLRAAVLGANDGIVSVGGLVVGVASATADRQVIMTAALAGIVAGAISMAAGEYVSVSSQKDSEKAQLEMEKYELEHFPDEELDELAGLYEKRGLSKKTAKTVAIELTKKDALKAHSEAELGINEDELTNPLHAAVASALSFVAGSLVPASLIILVTESLRIQVTFISVLIALAITGYLSAKVGGARPKKAVVRVVIGGALAMAITFFVGKIFSVSPI